MKAKNQVDTHHFTHSALKPARTGKNKHHVPPKHPDKKAAIIKVDAEAHYCYHRLFQNAPDFATAVYILRRDWWTDENGNPINPSI